YVIYTSGSTGRPKGVMIEHRGIVSLVKDDSVMPLGPDDILLSTASPSFDVAPFEFWAMLLNGGLLVLCDHDTLLNASLLKEEIRRRKVNKMWFTTSWFNQLLDRDINLFQGLDTVIIGGEKLSGPHIYQLRKAYPHLIILNGYGPTENSTYSTTFSVGAAYQGGEVPVGRPFKYRTAYILDDRQQLLPIGVTGEIYVGGAGLARGYWNQPALTEQRFIQVHLNNGVNARVYKTGDRGRWLPDGNIEYLGRLDGQVKIRGHRIEAGEIEAAIQGSGLVRQTIVTVRLGKDSQPRLVGYVVPDGRFDRQALRDHLRQCLPDYMIPVQWVEMTAFPLTGNGKTDLRRLPDPEDDAYIQDGYQAPQSDLEIRLAATWEELLGVTPIGLSDNFFSLGGHSLLLFPLADRLRRLGYPLAFKTLLAHPTIAQLAAHLERQEKKIAGARQEGIRIMHGSEEAPPLFLLPGSPGFTEPYEVLAGNLGERFCIYGVALNELPLSLDIRGAVDLVLEQIRQAQPNGPYRFIGHSFGADIAFDLTRRLEDNGACVDFVVLLDASARKPDLLEPGDGSIVDPRLSTLLHALLANHQCFLPPDWAETWMRETREMTKEDRLSFLVYHIASATGLRDKRLLRALHARLVHSAMPYQAVGMAKASLIVVRAEEEDWRGYGEFLGWQDHTRDVRAISAPGNHSSLVDEANGPLLAKRLAEHFPAANRNTKS
ncbi:AMP-binding protein, partial [Puia dinghuensis]|uniref:AMP-binding protein n=1 Tax=Puia dinghuensis TaxID=1792502 RepID=UPI00166CC983